MSIEHISWVLSCSEATGTQRLLLVGLANHADEDGEAWPGIALLARYAHVSESAARRALQALESDGQLRIEKNAGGTRKTPGNRKPNRYTLLSEGEPLTLDRALAGVARARPQDDEPGVAFEASGVAFDDARGRVAARVKPSLENPQLEPSEEHSVFAAFDAWWASYPKGRKVAQDQCRVKYTRAAREVGHQAIDDGLARWLAHWNAHPVTDEQFVTQSTTWLNQKRWQGEPPAKLAPKGAASHAGPLFRQEPDRYAGMTSGVVTDL